jgi:hypothetical protein
MNRNVVFSLVNVLAIVSVVFGLMAEAVHYREDQELHIGHVARTFTIPLIVIVIMRATRSGTRDK